MIIKPSSAIRNNYRRVADYCIETGQPIFLTNNGEGELVVMSIQAWNEERQRLQIEEALVRLESEIKRGTARYTAIEKVFSEIDRIIDETETSSI